MGNIVDWVKDQTVVGQATDWANEQTWSGDLMDEMGNSGWLAALMPETYLTSTLTDAMTQNDPIVGAKLWEWMNAQALGDYEAAGNDGVPTWLGYPAVGAAAWLGGSAAAGAAGGGSSAGAIGEGVMAAGAPTTGASVILPSGAVATGSTLAGASNAALGLSAAELGFAGASGAAGAAGLGAINPADYLVASAPSSGASVITPTGEVLAGDTLSAAAGSALPSATTAGSGLMNNLVDAGIQAALPSVLDAAGITSGGTPVTTGAGNMPNTMVNTSNSGIWGYIWEQQNPGADFATISNLMNEWQTAHPGENILSAIQSEGAADDPTLSKLSGYNWSGLQTAMQNPGATAPQYIQTPAGVVSNTAANLNIPSYSDVMSQAGIPTSAVAPNAQTQLNTIFGVNPAANMQATSAAPATQAVPILPGTPTTTPSSQTQSTTPAAQARIVNDAGFAPRILGPDTPGYSPNTLTAEGFMPDQAYFAQQDAYKYGRSTGTPGQQFAQAYDDLNFIQTAGGANSPAATSIQNTLSNSWSNMWNAVDANFVQQEANQIQTLVETLGSAFKDTFEGGVAALSARGLSSPDTSTTSDYWTSKWAQNAQTALAQGIRDIQTSTDQQRLAWNQFGISTAQDWDKFQVDAALTQRGQNLQYQTAANANLTDIYGINTSAGVTQRGQDISLQQSQAANALDWAQFGISTQQNAQQFDVNSALTQRGQDISAANSQNALAQNWAQFQASQNTDWQQYLLNLASVTRGQDLGVQQNAANNALTANLANSQMDWASDQSMYNLYGSILGNLAGSTDWSNLWSGISSLWK